jgi:hypothetical protein
LERIIFKLLRCEIEKVICIKIKNEPDQYNHSKGDKTCTVFNRCKKGQQKNPEGGIIGFSDQGKWVSERLLN